MKKLLLILSLSASSIFAADELQRVERDIQFLQKQADRLKIEVAARNQEATHPQLNEQDHWYAALIQTNKLIADEKQKRDTLFNQIERNGKIETLKRDINRLEWEALALNHRYAEWSPMHTGLAEDLKAINGLKKVVQKEKMLEHKQQELKELMDTQ